MERTAIMLSISPMSGWTVLVDQDPKGGTVEVVELATRGCPEEGRKPGQTEQQRHGYEDGDDAHRADLTRRRAFATTRIDEPDIASAAISGVTRPATASGTASTL